MVFNDISRERLGADIAKRIALSPSFSIAGDLPPVIFAGELRRRIRKVFAIGVEQRDGQGDDSLVTIVHLEGQADEAPTINVDEGADLDRVGAGRGNDDFSQVSAFRGDSAQATIAEAGGDGSAPGGGAN